MRRTALIVIDMQRDFCEVGGYAHRAGLDVSRLAAPMHHIRRLLDAARKARLVVVHTREGHLPDLSDCPPVKLARSIHAGAPIGSQGPLGRLLIRGETGHDFVPQLAPHPGEWVIDKPGYSAFHATTLHERLHALQVDGLILCGVTTEVCVHSTLRAAVDLGYRCITVRDACAASQPELQDAAMNMIEVEGGILGQVLTTDDLLEQLFAEELTA
ncbi:MAG TPA: cysteine hydrolase [Aquabacterium sp.]|nr:cysteine hydrolase [Aquabacterium sp.]